MSVEGDKYFREATVKTGIAAVRLYIAAAKSYSTTDKSLAGLCYSSAADILLAQRQRSTAIDNYIKSVQEYQGIDNNRAIMVLNRALKCMTGQHKRLAKYYNLLGKLNYKEGRILEAITAFDKSAQYYFSLQCHDKSSTCIAKIIIILIDNENYERALLYLDEINNKYKTQETFFALGVMRLFLFGTKDCTNLLIKEYDHMLSDGYFFLNDIILAIEINDKQRYDKLIVDYHYIKPLKSWQLSLLETIL